MIAFSTAVRCRQSEMMDDPGADPAALRKSLRYIRRVNRYVGYTRATLDHIQQFSRGWKAGERITIADLGTGSGDIPLAILRWANRSGFDVRIIALDLHAATVSAAQENVGGEPRIKIVQGDVLAMPLAEGACDYAMANMFLHHLDDAEIVSVLRTMDRLARRGIIFADLIRSRSAYWNVRASTMFSNAMVRHDAAVSIAQAFTEREVLALRNLAGLDYPRFHRHFGHRFVLAGEKGTVELSGA